MIFYQMNLLELKKIERIKFIVKMPLALSNTICRQKQTTKLNTKQLKTKTF